MDETFSSRLTSAMTSANIKQAELSEITGIAKSSISEYIAGNYEPKQKNIYKIATALNVAPSYLMGITDKPLASAETTNKKLSSQKQADLEKVMSSKKCMVITDEDEQDLVRKYRNMTDRGKNAVQSMMDAYLDLTASRTQDNVG